TDFIRALSANRLANGVFGDSHVSRTSMIEGYGFFGEMGQQPNEFFILVQFLYKNRSPGKIIVEAAPQWVGEYHAGQQPLLTTANLHAPINLFGLQILSLMPVYSGSLFRFLMADVASLVEFVSRSNAQQPLVNASQVEQYAN